METHFIEATNQLNWGKFMLGRFDSEWAARSALEDSKLLSGRGWTREHLLVLDLATGEGALFRVNQHGIAKEDLDKHRIWVCPLFQPFLEWLYVQPDLRFKALPSFIELEAPFAFRGYRREGGG